MTKTSLPTLLSLAVLTFALAACRPAAPQPGLAAQCAAAAEALANLTYSTELFASGSVDLTGGEFRAPAATGSAAEVVVQVTEDAACGTLNDIPSAAVILVSSSGGSGTFYSLHAVQPLEGTPAEVAYTVLGDRVKVEGLAIEDNLIRVNLVMHATDDPLCCPTQAVTQSYALEGDQLRLVSTAPQNNP